MAKQDYWKGPCYFYQKGAFLIKMHTTYLPCRLVVFCPILLRLLFFSSVHFNIVPNSVQCLHAGGFHWREGQSCSEKAGNKIGGM